MDATRRRSTRTSSRSTGWRRPRRHVVRPSRSRPRATSARGRADAIEAFRGREVIDRGARATARIVRVGDDAEPAVEQRRGRFGELGHVLRAVEVESVAGREAVEKARYVTHPARWASTKSMMERRGVRCNTASRERTMATSRDRTRTLATAWAPCARGGAPRQKRRKARKDRRSVASLPEPARLPRFEIRPT